MPAGPPTPQVPSDQYDVQTYGVAKLFVLLKGNVYTTIENPKGFARVDYPYYDGGNYRDIIDAAKLGRGVQNISKFNDSTVTVSGNVENTPGDFIISVMEDTIIGPVPDQVSTMMEQDDNFAHVAPHNELKARTLMIWFDTAPTGGPPPTIPSGAKIVGRCWADRYISEGTEIQQTVGAVYPAFPVTP